MTPPSTPTTRIRVLAFVALALLALLPSAAQANRSQRTVIQDDTRVLHSGDGAREQTLDEFRSLGVEILKIRIDWRSLAPAPDSESKPAGFDGANPAAYGDAWNKFDAAISGAGARGLDVMVLLGGRAPDWASRGGEGRRRPDPGEFGAFVRAVGTRYGSGVGAYMDPNARVDIWEVWNEGNLVNWLMPQYSKRGKRPVAPHVYRDLLYAASDGLDATGHGGDTLLYGELAPFARGGAYPDKIRPLRFLREMACLNKRYRPFRGKKARRRDCDNFRPLPGTGLGYHPYTLGGGPRVRQPHRDDAAIGELSRVNRALSRIDRRGRFETRRPGIYITEFGFQTNPPDPSFRRGLKRVAGFMAESEWLAFRNPRVRTYSQYPLWDDAGLAGFQAGLRFKDGRKKKPIYRAFELPFFVRLRSSSRVEVFGAVRAGSPGDQVTVQVRTGGRWRDLGTVTLGEQGYFRRTLRTAAAGSRDFRVRAGSLRSRKAEAVNR